MSLEGKELEGKLGNIGEYSFDVTDKGEIIITVTAKKNLGFGEVTTSNTFYTNIIMVAEEVAKKSKNKLDDAAIKKLKELLGLQ